MTALDYLKTLPAVVINVPGSDARIKQFSENVAPHLGELWRFPATRIEDARSEAFEFRRLVAASKATDPKGFFSNVNVFQCQDKTLERDAKQREYAATFSLYKTTRRVMSFAIVNGWDRFLVFEDDAMPRLDVLATLPAPPADADMVVWGGAIPMGAHNWDGEQYLSGKQSAYKLIGNPTGRYIATAYEMTRKTALTHYSKLVSYPHAVDCSWWYTMDAVKAAYSIHPTAFVQVGPSDRIVKMRDGKYER